MTEAYRIEKVKVGARLWMRGGAEVEGEIFLQPSMPYRLGPQRPIELLNERDAFFPVETSPGQYLLVAKDSVERIAAQPIGDAPS